MPKVALDTPAPDFELADQTGRPVRLSALRGRVGALGDQPKIVDFIFLLN